MQERTSSGPELRAKGVHANNMRLELDKLNKGLGEIVVDQFRKDFELTENFDTPLETGMGLVCSFLKRMVDTAPTSDLRTYFIRLYSWAEAGKPSKLAEQDELEKHTLKIGHIVLDWTNFASGLNIGNNHIKSLESTDHLFEVLSKSVTNPEQKKILEQAGIVVNNAKVCLVNNGLLVPEPAIFSSVNQEGTVLVVSPEWLKWMSDTNKKDSPKTLEYNIKTALTLEVTQYVLTPELSADYTVDVKVDLASVSAKVTLFRKKNELANVVNNYMKKGN